MSSAEIFPSIQSVTPCVTQENGPMSVGHITHMRSMRKKHISNYVTLAKCFASVLKNEFARSRSKVFPLRVATFLEENLGI